MPSPTRGRIPRFVLTLLLLAVPAAAQDTQDPPPPTPPVDATSLFDVGTAEWMVTGGVGQGVVLFHSAPGHRFALQTLSWGRVLSKPRGKGAWRGRFEWAFEVVPLFGQYQPTNTYGFGFSPLVWRWNFEPRGRLAPYAELGGGALLTNDPVPQRTTSANFSAHAGYGLRILLRPQQALVVSYRLHHISNGNRVERNPGVNAHVVQVGWAYVRPRK